MWIREQGEGREQLHVFLRAAGLKSRHSVDDRDVSCHNPLKGPARIASLLGGAS